MVGGVPPDWLVRELIRGIRGDEGPPSNSHHLFYCFTMSGLFQTDNSNLPSSFLYPRVIGTKAEATYDLTTAVGTITQIDKRAFDKAYNGQGRYPLNKEVCGYGNRCWKSSDVMVFADHRLHAQREGPSWH